MKEPEPLHLIIHTDVGVDDAVAILLALRSKGVCVEAITTVSGNVDVEQAVRNARYLLELCERTSPVYRGAAGPIAGALKSRGPVYGPDGLGGIGLRPLLPGADPGDAAERLVAMARARPREATLVTLGPLTNVAQALRLAPDLAMSFRRVVIMGGAAFGPGTVTQRAEFNIWCDPVAARDVLLSGMPITMVPIDLSRGTAAHSASDRDRLVAGGTSLSEFAVRMCAAAAQRAGANSATASAGLPDVIAMAVALDPSLVLRSNRYFVDIETAGEPTSGETVVDYLGLGGREPNVELIEEIDEQRYKSMLREACL